MPGAPRPHTAYLGLGSNLNQPIKQVLRSIDHINRIPNTQVVGIADFYQSEPWGIEDQPLFVNTAVKIQTRLTPLALLKAVKIIEYRLMHRKMNQRWSSRVIDIDLLLWNLTTINRQHLTVPHPWIAQRCFVIQPLMELSPKLPVSLRQQITQHQKQHHCINSLKRLKAGKPLKTA